jgi:hypothetical protein
MSWVDDEAQKAKGDDEEKARSEQAYQDQRWGLWNDLRHRMEQDVEMINQNQDLIKRRLGGEKLTYQDNEGGEIDVTKITFTAVYLRVRNRGRYVEVEREIVTNGQSRRSKKEKENLPLSMDQDYRLYLKTEADNKPLTIQEASQYLLSPLLNT